MDIGDTLIGMHLKEVAVPVRIERRHIGAARVICARTRLKFTGGARESVIRGIASIADQCG